MRYPEDFATVTVLFTTNDATGAPIAPSSAFTTADFKIYKNGSATEKATTNGLTVTSPFDSVVGSHLLLIDTSNDTGDSGFWTAGAVYDVKLDTAKTVDGKTVSRWLDKFFIDTQAANIATLLAGVNVTSISGDSVAADNAEAFFDGTGYAGTNNVIPTVTTVNGLAANVITATSIASDAITAAKVAADVTTEIQSGLATAAALAVVDGIVDDILVDTGTTIPATLATIAGYLDTEIAAIKAKTDNLPAAPAATGDIPSAASIATAVLTTQMTESYSTDGATPTLAQAQFLTMQRLYDFAISGTTITVKKIDGSTTAATITIDSATVPTSSSRAT